jgi:hypothetical protein
MRTSKEIIELLDKHMFFQDRFRWVELCWDAKIGFSTSSVDSLLAKMHEMSLAYVVGDMATHCPFGESPYLIIYLQPSTDGQTNIDVGFMEELAKINLKSDNAKDETFRRTHEPCS